MTVDPIKHSLRIENEIQWSNLGLRIKTVMETLPPEASILVIGSGIGELPTLLRLYGFTNITTLDANKEVNPDIVHNILFPLPIEDNTYDAVIAFHVLEHIDFVYNYFPALAEIYRVIKPMGVFFFAVPYRAWYFTAIMRFCRWSKIYFGPFRILKNFTPHGTHFWEVARNHPEKKVKEKIELAGFQILTKISTPMNPVELFLICAKVPKEEDFPYRGRPYEGVYFPEKETNKNALHTAKNDKEKT